MPDKIQQVASHFRASTSRARPADDQWEEENTSESSSQSPPQRLIHQSQTPQHGYFTRSAAAANRNSPEQVDSDSDSDSVSHSDSDSDSDSHSQSDSESNSEEHQSEGDGEDGVAEAQHDDHHATGSTPASSPPPADEAISMLVTNPVMLHCSVCNTPLSTPVFMCENGHTSCSRCQFRTMNTCPSCNGSTKFNHCRSLEIFIESLHVECKFKKFGCKETFLYHQKADHENICPYTACFCPIPSCGFCSSSTFLYSHFRGVHSAIPFSYNTVFDIPVLTDHKNVVLQERNEKVIFIVNHGVHEHGRTFNVDCIGPPCTFKKAFLCQMTVNTMEECISVESVPEVYTEWKEHIPDNVYIVIPPHITGFSIQMCIKKAHQVDMS